MAAFVQEAAQQASKPLPREPEVQEAEPTGPVQSAEAELPQVEVFVQAVVSGIGPELRQAEQVAALV
jgi:hypothetical protein